MNPKKLNIKGNKKLYEHTKTAFFCSRNCPATIISRSYDWALEQKNIGNCIISGFHSQIERDVLHFLLKGDQPIIMVLARSLYKRIPDQELKLGLEKGNLLMVSAFDEKVKRASLKTARERNELMIELANEIMVAFASQNGLISNLIPNMVDSNKKLFTFNVEETKELQNMGFIPLKGGN